MLRLSQQPMLLFIPQLAPLRIGLRLMKVDLHRPRPRHLNDFKQRPQPVVVHASRPGGNPIGGPFGVTILPPFPAFFGPMIRVEVPPRLDEIQVFPVGNKAPLDPERSNFGATPAVLVVPPKRRPVHRLPQLDATRSNSNEVVDREISPRNCLPVA